MSDERWGTLWEAFHAAAALPAAERAAYLDEACGDDSELRAEVEELLAQEGSHGFLDSAPALAELAAEALDPERLIGERVGAYTIESVIGEGGMGTVYAAVQQEPVRRRVALKIIKLGMDTREVVARFESERQALALMSHPGIAAVLDCGATDDGRPYFAMELVEGVPITRYCDRHHLSVDERLDIFAAVCDAVQHAHRKGIIHRDLKPSNVLVVDEQGSSIAKVIDFGIAKATHEPLTDRTLRTGLGHALGTPEYMSPEQAAGDLDVDTQADVYSLGVLLYEILAGVLPFDTEGKGYDEVREQTQREDPRTLSRRFSGLGDAREPIAVARATDAAQLARQLRGDLEWIVAKALSRDRDLRYGTAADLGADVRRYRANEPVSAGPPSSAYRMKKFVRRHRAAVVGSAAVLVTLVGGIVVATWLAMVAAADRETAVLAQADAEEARDEARFEAETAQAINDLLIETLGSPDPERSSWSPEEARNVRVVEVLQRAADESADRFADRPHLEASVRGVVGRTFLRLGLFQEAEAELQRAVAATERAHGPDAHETMTARHNLASTVEDLGRHEEAIALYRATLADRRRVLGEAHHDTLTTATNLAGVLLLQDQTEEAATLYEEALGLGNDDTVQGEAILLQALTGLAFIHGRNGESDEAAALYQQILERRRAALGDLHPATLAAIGNLGVTLQRAGRMEEAAVLLEEAVAGDQQVHGPRHSSTLNDLGNLAVLRRQMGDLEAAAGLMQEVVDANTEILGPDHPQTLISVNNLARTVTDLGDLERAAELYADFMPRAHRILPAGHVNLALFQGGYGLFLLETGSYEGAEAELTAAHGILSGTIGSSHPQTLSQVRRLVQLYVAWGKPDKAAEYRALLPPG